MSIWCLNHQSRVPEEWKKGILDCVANYAARLADTADPEVHILDQQCRCDTGDPYAEDPLTESSQGGYAKT